MVANSTIILLVLISHVAIISSSGVHTFTYNGHVFTSDFLIAPGGSTVLIDGKPYQLTVPVNYDNATLKNITLNLISLIDYLNKHDPLLTVSQKNTLENTRKTLTTMLTGNAYELNALQMAENTIINVYYLDLSKMRSDKNALLKQMSYYIEVLNSTSIPPKLLDNAREIRSQMLTLYRKIYYYDYGIDYFYSQLEPEAESLINKAEFIVEYPQVLEELNAVKSVYSYLDAEGLLNDQIKQLWIQNFSPMYVKFIRGLYVTPNVTVMEGTLINYLNQLKQEANDNLLKAQKKVEGYTNPPFYQKGKYEKQINEYLEELNNLQFKKFDNSTLAEVKELVKIYKASKELPSKVSHTYYLDLILSIIVAGLVIGYLMARL